MNDNSKKVDTLTNNIYIDSDYEGEEKGTIEKPFKSFESLYKSELALLQNVALKTIHLLSTNIVISADGLKNCTFVSENIDRSYSFTLTNSKNITITNMTINDLSTIICDKLSVYNANIGTGGNRSNKHNFKVNDLKINCCKINIGDGLYVENNNAICNYEINNCDGYLIINGEKETNVEISNSNLSLNVSNKNLDLTINDSVITFLNNIRTDNGYLNFISGTALYINEERTFKAKTINLGTFDFSAIDCTFDGSVSLGGLSSKQIYDSNDRSYNNDNKTLESHLTAIDNAIKNLQNNSGGSNSNGDSNIPDNPTVVEIKDAYNSAGTFRTINELKTYSYDVGDVFKYISDAPTTLTNNIELENPTTILRMTDNVIDFDDPDNGGLVDYYLFEFNVKNAGYYKQIGGNVKLSFDDVTYDLEATYFSVDKITARIEVSLIDKIEIDENTYEYKLKETPTNITYTHSISLMTNDKVVRLSNGWDKLSESANTLSTGETVFSGSVMAGKETTDDDSDLTLVTKNYLNNYAKGDLSNYAKNDLSNAHIPVINATLVDTTDYSGKCYRINLPDFENKNDIPIGYTILIIPNATGSAYYNTDETILLINNDIYDDDHVTCIKAYQYEWSNVNTDINISSTVTKIYKDRPIKLTYIENGYWQADSHMTLSSFMVTCTVKYDSWVSENENVVQRISCPCLLDTDSPIIDVKLFDDIDSNKLLISTWSHIIKAVIQRGVIILYTDGVTPDIDFQINMKVVR